MKNGKSEGNSKILNFSIFMVEKSVIWCIVSTQNFDK